MYFIILIKAGIPDNQLEIALEPEAASIYCQLMHLDDIQRDNTSEKWERTSGVNYMVIDLGGISKSNVQSLIALDFLALY